MGINIESRQPGDVLLSHEALPVVEHKNFGKFIESGGRLPLRLKYTTMIILPILEQIVAARINNGDHSELRVKLSGPQLDRLAEEAPLAVRSPFWIRPPLALYLRISGIIVKAEDSLSEPVHEAFKNIEPC